MTAGNAAGRILTTMQPARGHFIIITTSVFT